MFIRIFHYLLYENRWKYERWECKCSKNYSFSLLSIQNRSNFSLGKVVQNYAKWYTRKWRQRFATTIVELWQNEGIRRPASMGPPGGTPKAARPCIIPWDWALSRGRLIFLIRKAESFTPSSNLNFPQRTSLPLPLLRPKKNWNCSKVQSMKNGNFLRNLHNRLQMEIESGKLEAVARVCGSVCVCVCEDEKVFAFN